MQATDFEYHYQTPLHLLIVGLALLAYLISPDDIVWALVRHHSNSAAMERVAFGAGALAVLASASLETWMAPSRQRLARLLFALSLGLLLPLPGAMLLVAGEAILIFRLFMRDRGDAGSPEPGGFRAAVSKWGVAASMLVLTVTLRDRLAETIAASGFVLWLAFNGPSIVRSRKILNHR